MQIYDNTGLKKVAGAGGGGMSTHDSGYHSGNIFPGANQNIGSAFLDWEVSTTNPANPGAGFARLFAYDRFGIPVLRYLTPAGREIQLAQDNVLVVRNETGVSIPIFTPVYESGTGAGGEVLVAPAQANSSTTMPALGLVMEAIGNNSNGRIMLGGVLQDVNTLGFSPGDILYVSATVAGGLTITPPAHPNMRQRIARILTSAASGTAVVVARQPKGNADDIGTPVNSWAVGNGAAGAKSILFSNVNVGHLAWDPSAGRTIHLPDGNGTLLTTQSGQALSGSNGSFAFQTATFGNLNGLSFYTSNGSLVGSYTVPTQTVQPVAISGSNGSFNFSTVTFGNLNGISFYTSNGSMVASHNALTSQSNQAFSAGAASSAFQTLVFQDSNGISFSNNAGSIRLTHGLAGTTTGFAGANISGSMTLNSLGLNLSLSVAAPGGGGAINVSAGTTSGNLQTIVFSNSNGVSFGLNGSTVTASVAAGGGGAFTYPGIHPYDDLVMVLGQVGQGSLIFDPQPVPNVSFDRLQFFLQNTNSSNSSGSHTLRFTVGLYTRNGSTLSLYTSWAGSTALTHSGTAGSYSWYSGQRLFALTIPATSIPENRYWIAFLSSTSSAGANGTYSNYLASQLNSQYTGLFGQASNASMQPRLGQGVYSATTTALPACGSV